MTDVVDIAGEREQLAREDALAEQRRRAGLSGDKTAADSAEFCQDEDCGMPIPAARRAAVPGCQLCIECQERREKRA